MLKGFICKKVKRLGIRNYKNVIMVNRKNTIKNIYYNSVTLESERIRCRMKVRSKINVKGRYVIWKSGRVEKN